MKTYDMTHLARIGKPPVGQSRISAALERYLTKMGLMQWATFNYQGGVFAGTATGPTYSPGAFSVVDVKLDFAAIAAANVAAGRAALASADVIQVVGVKAGAHVLTVALNVVTVEGGTATVDCGDGTSTAGFFAGANLNALGWTSNLITSALSIATAGGKIYTVDDTIDLVLNNNTIDVAVAHLMVVQFDLRQQRA
jgi:hypothetical protein